MPTVAELLCQASGLPSGTATFAEHLCALEAGGGTTTVNPTRQLDVLLTRGAALQAELAADRPLSAALSRRDLSALLSRERALQAELASPGQLQATLTRRTLQAELTLGSKLTVKEPCDS